MAAPIAQSARRLALIVAGLACLTSASYATESPPQFITAWGAYGSGVGQFINPWGLAIDPAGFVYVADQANHRICKFTHTGEFVLAWGSYGTGPGQFHATGGIDADETGRVFVSDLYNDRVQIFTSGGVFLNQIEHLSRPYDVAVGPSGTVYVADTENSRIAKFAADGSFIGELGLGGGNPTGVAVDAEENLYVADDWYVHDWVAKYDPAGNLLMTIGSVGPEPGQLNGPAGLAIDAAGNIYVADHGNSRVQKFGPTGSLLSYWGTYGTGNGQFNVTLDVALGPDGSIYVSDTGNHRIQKFAHVPVSAASATWGSVKARYRPERVK